MNKYDLYPSLALYDQLSVPYVLHDSKWNGPLWTGHCMMLDAKDDYEDVGFFHELAHWIEASPGQRRYPDMQLGQQINSSPESTFATSSTSHFYDKDSPTRDRATVIFDRNPGWGERPVKISTAARQETNACYAMFFYSPLVGRTSWLDTDIPPGAALAFDGTFAPALSQTSGKIADQVKKIIQSIDPAITRQDIVSYFTRMKDHCGYD